ncbi:MAG: radical SAM protein [Candidatus Brocadiia bacterium]
MVAQIAATSGAYMKKVNWLHLRAHDSCNLSCSYCVMSARRGRPGADAMTAEQAVEILRLLLANSSAPRITVEISGGEPLLCGSRWIAAICGGLRVMETQYAKKLDLWITTNGTLLNEEIIAVLRECKARLSVGVDAPAGVSGGVKTLDGRVRRGIELLQKLYTTPGINAVATLPAMRHVTRFMNELKQMNIRLFRLTAVNSRGRAQAAPGLLPTSKESFACTMRLIRYMERCDFSIVEASALDRVYRYMGDVYEPNFCNAPTCPAGSGFLAVDAKGDVYPCGNETRDRFIMGNIYDGFDGPRSRRVLAAYHGELAPFVRCVYCKAGRICHYGCPGCLHEGDTRHFDAECQFTQLLFERFERDRAAIEEIYRRAKRKAPSSARKHIPGAQGERKVS